MKNQERRMKVAEVIIEAYCEAYDVLKSEVSFCRGVDEKSICWGCWLNKGKTCIGLAKADKILAVLEGDEAYCEHEWDAMVTTCARCGKDFSEVAYENTH